MRVPVAIITVALVGLALLVAAVPVKKDVEPKHHRPPRIDVDIDTPSWVPVPIPLPGDALGYGYSPMFGGDLGVGEAPRSSAAFTTRVSDGRTTRTLTVRSGDPRGGATEETVTPRWPAGVLTAVTRLKEQPDADATMREGTSYFRSRDFARAAERFRRAVPLDPDNGLPRLQYAHALFALADYQGAAYSLRRGLELLPAWPSSGHDLRALYDEPRDLDDQLESLRAHLRQNPDDADGWLVLGYVRFFSRDLDGATAALAALPPDDRAAASLRTEIARLRDR